MLIWVLNLPVENKFLKLFTITFDLECLIKKSTWFQSTNPSFFDLTLTNKKEFLKDNYILKVGIYDHHHLKVTALRSQLVKGKTKTKLHGSATHLI